MADQTLLQLEPTRITASRDIGVNQIEWALREALGLAGGTQSQRRLFAVSSLGVDVWQPGDDVKLVAQFDITPTTFWLLVAENLDCEALKTETAGLFRTLPYSLELLKDLRHLRATGTRFLLAFCGWPNGLGRVGPHSSLRPAYGERSRRLGPEGQTLNLVWETTRMSSSFKVSGRMDGSALPDFEGASHAYMRIHAWACRNGLMGAEFGLLDSDCLIRMFCYSVEGFQPDDTRPNKAPCNPREPDLLVHNFFALFKHLNWDKRGVYGDNTEWGTEMAIWTASEPPINAAQHVTKGGKARIWAALQGLTLPYDGFFQPEHNPEDPLTHFLDAYDYYIVTVGSFWGQNPEKAIDFELRLGREIAPATCRAVDRLLVLRTFAWPFPLSLNESDGDNPDHKLLYVAGVAPRHPSTLKDKKTFLKQVANAARTAEQQIPPTSLDSNWEHVSIKVCTSADFVNPNTNRPRPLQSLTPLDKYRPTPSTPLLSKPPTSQSPPSTQRPPPDVSNLASQTAANMLHKLRWHPWLNGASYEVGYQDRFDGLMWKALEEWRSAREAEEEDWIPEHRIRAFRRVGDGVWVWWRR
ncbi:hypothetical protein MBLNU230_g0317t1 [Neophaeotheca triangularis]